MILTDLYTGEHLPDSPKTRYEVTACTKEYEPFEMKLKNKRGANKGGLSFYFGDVPDRWHFASKDRPDKAITKGENISSVFVPDVSLPFAFGDVKGTQDALLIIQSNEWLTLEIFIARGQRNNKRNLYHLLCDKELNNEIENLRNQAKK
jgi:hypothetical protein